MTPGFGPGFFMFGTLAFAAINRFLRAHDAWALETLKPHAGKTALIASPPFESRFMVTDRGELIAGHPDAPPDVTVMLTPGVLLRLAARDEAAWSAADVSGDVQFAAAIDYVRRNLTWDVEESLSRVVGDIAAHRIAGVGRELERWGRAAVVNLGQSVAEYAVHEQPMFASARAVEEFNQEVDEVRDHAARLQKRLEFLSRGTGS
jgi:ubiquinone biosynthesis protein UbiJ